MYYRSSQNELSLFEEVSTPSLFGRECISVLRLLDKIVIEVSTPSLFGREYVN
jgi:hypothetical protein